MAVAGRDNIGTGWAFPVRVDRSGAARVRSTVSEPYDFSAFPNGGILWISVNGELQQSFLIPTGSWTASQVANDYLQYLKGATAFDDGGYLLIVSDEDNPTKSAIVIDGPADLGINLRRNAALGLGLPLGVVNGYGKGNIAYTRNPDPELVTEEETMTELREALLIMLMTNPGEVPMFRSYGVGLWDLLFQPLNNRLTSLIRYKLKQGIVKWDNRVTPTNVQVGFRGTDAFLRIGYAARETQTESELIVPVGESSV